MSKEITIIKPSDVSDVKTRVLEVQQRANELDITDELVMRRGESMLTVIKTIENEIKSRKEEITRPLMQALASARDLFKPLEIGHEDAKRTIKTKMLSWQSAEDERVATEKARLEARVEKGTMKAETAAGKLETINAAPRANVRVIRKLEIFDGSLIPREYCEPVRELVTQALMSGHEVPGARFVEEKIIVTK